MRDLADECEFMCVAPVHPGQSHSCRSRHDCVLQRLLMLTIGISVAAFYVRAQLYAECTLTEWSAWGPCTDSEVVRSLFLAAAVVAA